MATALLTNETTNTSGTPVEIDNGGYKLVRFYGTFDSATCTLEMDFGDGNWVPAQDSGQTVEGVIYLQCAQGGMRIRATTTNVGGSTSISVDFI
jgi:hypothetical protein